MSTELEPAGGLSLTQFCGRAENLETEGTRLMLQLTGGMHRYVHLTPSQALELANALTAWVAGEQPDFMGYPTGPGLAT